MRSKIAIASACLAFACASPRPTTTARPSPVATTSAVPATKPTAPREARLVSVDDLHLGELVVGRAPTKSIPRGSIFALGFAKPPNKGAFIVEIDLASASEIGRVQIDDDGERPYVSLARDGARLYALVERTGSHLLIELDENLAVVRRGTLSTHPGAKKKKPPSLAFDHAAAFAVFDGKPIVLAQGPSAEVFQFGEDGGLRVRRDCKGTLFSPYAYALERRGKRVLITGLYANDTDTLACMFDIDGASPDTDRLVIAPGTFFSVADDALVLSGQDDGGPWLAPVDEKLKVGPKSSPPKVSEQGSTKPLEPKDECPGLRGTAIWQRVVASGVLVIRTINCCGAVGPSGIHVCS